MKAFCVSGAWLVLAIAAGAAAAGKPHYEIPGKVVKIADGDTLTVLDSSNEQHGIRLAGIDAPEKGQPFGTKAREALAGKVFGQSRIAEVCGDDLERFLAVGRSSEAVNFSVGGAAAALPDVGEGAKTVSAFTEEMS